METTMSTRGQVVLPQAIRKKLNLQPGDRLAANVEGERIVLVPKRRRARKARIIKDPLTGYPVLTAGKNTPTLTQKEVERILPEFP